MDGRFFEALEGDLLRCTLCPHGCALKDGGHGLCMVRENAGGRPALPYYGKVSAIAVDPIEKKPLYHYRCGEPILSVGFVGCNLRCPFCQNWEISQGTDAVLRSLPPSRLAMEIERAGTSMAAYTYSEPLVHAEYLLDSMEAVRDAGYANILVTNGCAASGAAREILSLCDGVNIDLKSFSADTYRKVLGGDLAGVLAFIAEAVALGVHTEITTLVVPGLNDSLDELDACADFIAGLSPEIPWHLSAYHPAYKHEAPPTEGAFLLEYAQKIRRRLPYVYVGNLGSAPNNTYCHSCGKEIVRRNGYRVNVSGLSWSERGGRKTAACAYCGVTLPFH